MKEVILEDFNNRIETNVDVDFFLLATFLDPRWKELRMVSKQRRENAFEREMSSFMQTTSPVKAVDPEPKKRKLLDFDESDESCEAGDEEDVMDAELKRFELPK